MWAPLFRRHLFQRLLFGNFLGLIFGNLIFWELKFFRTYFLELTLDFKYILLGLGVFDFLSICRKIIIVIKTAKNMTTMKTNLPWMGWLNCCYMYCLPKPKWKWDKKLFCLFKLELKYPISRVISFLVNHRNM